MGVGQGEVGITAGAHPVGAAGPADQGIVARAPSRIARSPVKAETSSVLLPSPRRATRHPSDQGIDAHAGQLGIAEGEVDIALGVHPVLRDPADQGVVATPALEDREAAGEAGGIQTVVAGTAGQVARSPCW